MPPLKERQNVVDYSQSLECRIEKLAEEIRNKGRRLFLYGTGAQSSIVRGLIEAAGISDYSFIVDDKYFTKTVQDGFEVLKFGEYAKKQDGNDCVWICIDNRAIASEIAGRLASRNIIMTTFPLEAYRAGTFLDYRYCKEHETEFAETLSMFGDKESSDTCREYLRACASGDVTELAKHNREVQYFNDVTRAVAHAVFVDCGAFVGDSASGYLGFFGADEVRKIYSFEPDESNIRVIRKKIEDGILPRDKLELIGKGVSDKHAVLRFNSSGDGSAISEDGDAVIEVDSIDELVFVRDKVDFIKMDVEGSELKALHGAAKTIARDHPALAVCVYHKKEDLITIPRYIASLVPHGTYSYHLRIHNDTLMELVFYAIPKP
jgi:FkbM family methyltransferase